jgi:hypothetical protein
MSSVDVSERNTDRAVPNRKEHAKQKANGCG